jgi:hypothetical protein
MPTQAPFPVNESLTAIALSYRNEAMIADMVLPRVPVATDAFKYFKWNRDEAFTVPDTKIGRKSEANVVEFGGTEVTDSTFDYGLKDMVPVQDLRNSLGTPFDPLGMAALGTTRLMTLDRELRTAALVFGAGNYAAANKATLSGTSQWSDYTNSNPLSAMLIAFDGMLMRPNKLVLGQAVWTILRQHPRILEAIKGTGAGVNSQGTINRQQLAELLEIQEVIVGSGWVNGGKKGAAASYARCWGKFAAAIYTEPVTTTEAATTFGFTAESGGGLRVRDWFDEKIGTDGAQVVQVVDTVKEVLPANDLGYLWSAAVA